MKTPPQPVLQPVPKRFDGFAIVAAPGPSLTQEVADRIQGLPTVAVKGAYRLLPNATILYQCERNWWINHEGCPTFQGERWSSHGQPGLDDKAEIAPKYNIRLVQGRHGKGFSLDPNHIHYGRNSGFQAVNLALLMGATTILLVGFDMRAIDGNRYFHGKHTRHGDHRQDAGFVDYAQHFAAAVRTLPATYTILNATPNSALTCFQRVDLHDYLSARPQR